MPTSHKPLTEAGQFYVAAVGVAGSLIVLHSLVGLASESIGYQWFVLAGLTLLSGSFTIRIPTISARLSVSDTFVFAAAILFGPAAATIIVVLDSLIISLWLRRASRKLSRVVFNMAAPSIAIWVAAHTFFRIAGIEPLDIRPRPILSLVAPLLVLAFLYFLLNSSLIAVAVAFERRLSAFQVWRDNFLWLSLNYFSGASVAALLLPYLQDDQRAFIRVAGILLPLLLISYLTFKTALGRVDDANRHLSELNRLYLSTIETLAMAIDAKDQITHGHIRRVQQYAVGLAKAIGVTDSAQIKAIEAASLLHDMGKLAVPEYILNKPGKLSPAEFDKMKLHASVGAEILSAIEFPYPVVPIVRHHHENWDGSGYPDGLKGSDIPIGARILSVVDCFDALTSDRPYRPRLSDADAVRILVERRDSMYDPLMVDTFIAVFSDIAPRSDDTEAQHSFGVLGADLKDPREHEEASRGLDNINASTEETLGLFELARGISEKDNLADRAELVARHVRRAIPSSTSILYLYDATTDELVAMHATGEHSGHFRELRIPRGQRLTGWVAANHQSILNSDPVLDLGEAARALHPRLRTCLSTPLVHDGTLVGVLTLYSVQRELFTEDHRRLAEIIGKQIAPALKQDIRGSVPASRTYELTRVKNKVAAELTAGVSMALIQMRISRGGHAIEPSDRVVTLATDLIQNILRPGQVLLPSSRGEWVIIMSANEVETAAQLMNRIGERIRQHCESSNDRDLAYSKITIGVATSPSDGAHIDDLVAVARQRGRSMDDSSLGQRSIH